MKRHKDNKDVEIAKNTKDILTAINNHVAFLGDKVPNQTDKKYHTYDIACNEDFALHSKHHDWRTIFNFFKNHDKAKASLATKIIPVNLLDYEPEGKIRIRFSLMPQEYSSKLEPNTPKIIDRIKAINAFIDAGYEVHINFSPVIVEDGWLKKYDELFEMVDDYVEYKDEVKAEVIFLTHNVDKHYANKDRPGEELLWKPNIQESKNSMYGGRNIRYHHKLKKEYIKQFKNLHDSIIPWNTIRYIF
jgi:spore photoproduct lyase